MIWPFADALVTAAAGAAVIAVVVIVILAIIIAVMEGIRVTENAALPGKVAELVVNARTTVTDPATLIGTTDGALTLYNLFVGATMPRPRNDRRLRQLPDPAVGLLHQLRPEPHRLRPAGQQHRDHEHARPQRLPQPASDPGGVRDRPALPGPLRQPDAAGGPDHRGRRPDLRKRQDRPAVRQLVRHQARQPDRRRRPVPAAAVRRLERRRPDRVAAPRGQRQVPLRRLPVDRQRHLARPELLQVVRGLLEPRPRSATSTPWGSRSGRASRVLPSRREPRRTPPPTRSKAAR